MSNLELSDWLVVIGPILLVIALLVALKVAYALKSCATLPPKKPKFCFLPKYAFSLPINGSAGENELPSHLKQFGFQEKSRSKQGIVFSRGSELGDFSIKIAKLIVTAELPLTDPVQLKIEYGVAFGCAFDTGDLCKFCHELIQKMEAQTTRPASVGVESDNPYQPPQN